MTLSPSTPLTAEPWATADDVPAACRALIESEALVDEALQVASDILFNLTQRRYPGAVDDTVRPCADRRPGRDTSRNIDPRLANIGGVMYGAMTGACGCNVDPHHCMCSSLSTIELPGYPVVEIVSVTIDGVTIDPAEYRLDDDELLVGLDRLDGQGRRRWPCCQSEDHPFVVVYRYGRRPPPGGVRAAASLGCELGKSWSPDPKSSRLPKRVTSITRQNVSMAVIDPLSLFKDGLTGLADVDLWVQSELRGIRERRSAVIVPEFATRKVRRTGEPAGS